MSQGIAADRGAPGDGARQRLLVIHPLLTTIGGGNGVAAWFLAALRRQHAVTLLTWRPPDLDGVNRVFGTDLAVSDFACRPAPAWLRHLLSPAPLPLALLKDSILVRHARHLAGDYDLLISTSGEHDLGGHGLQYVHFPRFEPFSPPDPTPLHHRALPVQLYRRGVFRVTGTVRARVGRNRTLANSAWVAQRYRALHDAAVEVLHPPAAGPFPDVPWEARADGVVCIGRFGRSKRLEVIIEIVERVRAAGSPLRLHVVGLADDPDYAAEIRRLANARRDWITLYEGLSRAELCALIAGQRYGIHGMVAEHFGMAVAELVAGGCISFVPDDGGQCEIVGHDPRLLFRSAAEGAEKIARVVGDPVLQRVLRDALAPHRAAFTPERFMRRVREVVAECIAGRAGGTAPDVGATRTA